MLYIIRHGQTDGNIEGKLKHYTDDTPLNNIGIMEAIESGVYLRKHVKKFDHIFVSPTKRTIETLDYILKSYDGEQNIKIDERIKEIDVPDEMEDIAKNKKLQKEIFGYNYNEIYNTNGILERYDLAHEYDKKVGELWEKYAGETGKSYYDRTMKLVDDLIKILKEDNKNILVVGHGGTIDSISKFITHIQSCDIENFYKSTIKNNVLGKGNCILGAYIYTKNFGPFGPLSKENRLGLVAGFDNTHLRPLYDNFKPIFVLFTPLFSDESIWHHKSDDNDLSFFDQISKLGDVIIDEPKFNQYIKNPEQCDFSLEDMLFDNHNTKLYEKLIDITKYKDYGSFLDLEYRKIVVIGYDISCVYAFHFSNKYYDKCHSLILINNRRFTEKNYNKTKDRIIKGVEYFEDNKINFDKKLVMQMIDDVDNNNYTSANFKDLLTSSDKRDNVRGLIKDYIVLTLRKQYDSIPTKCAIPTIIYNNITLSLDVMIEHNMKDEYTKHIKNIKNEQDAIYAHCETNMERYNEAQQLYKNSSIDMKKLIKVYYVTSHNMLKDSHMKDDMIRDITHLIETNK